MNNIDLTPVLMDIGFIDRYKKLCEDYNDFDNRMREVDLDMINKLLESFGYDYTYDSKEQFYKLVNEIDEFTFILQLVLKDGIVEPLLNIKFQENYYNPYGRFDFIPKKMGVDFDRKRYNLPKYSSKQELEKILGQIFSIFEDIKNNLVRTKSQV